MGAQLRQDLGNEVEAFPFGQLQHVPQKQVLPSNPPMLDTAHARALIDLSIARHGGADRWSRLRHIALQPRALSGLVPWIKGNGRTFGLPSRAEIEPQVARLRFDDYPRQGEHGVFDAGRVALGDAPPAERRGTFRGLAKWRRWMRCISSATRSPTTTRCHGPCATPSRSLSGEPAPAATPSR
jgi:hypothetical protein